MKRIAVVGPSGSGKTTLARRLATELRCDHIELDSIFHQPGWTQLPDDQFRKVVHTRVAAESWVTCGNYERVQDLILNRADTVIWLDLPRRVVMLQLFRRTVRRFVTREELWNGIREPLSNFYSLVPENNVFLWAWNTYDKLRDRYTKLATSDEYRHLTVIRLTARSDITTLSSSGC